MKCPVCNKTYDATEKFFESKRLKNVLRKKSDLCICILCLAKRENSAPEIKLKAKYLGETHKSPVPEPEITITPKKIDPGVIYVIGPKNGPYKVGLTTISIHDPYSRVIARMQGLQTGCWKQLEIHHISKPLKNVQLMEYVAHSALSEKRLWGERFDYDLKTIIDVIDKICDIPSVVNQS